MPPPVASDRKAVPESQTGERIAQLAAETVASASPGEALRKLSELRRELDAFERVRVAQALAEGTNFAMIARDLGVSRQAVHRRFRDLARDRPPLLSTPETRRVLRYAGEEATALGSDVPRGEHVLLAVLRAADLPASAVLRNAGVTLTRARARVEELQSQRPRFQRAPREIELRQLLASPAREARRRRSHRIEVEHLLLGALELDGEGAASTLTALGVEPGVIRDALAALLETGSG
jgi:ATP-dependent Clp protease ATP-binding subunit ClpA